MKKINLIITLVVVFVTTAYGEVTSSDAAALNIFKAVMERSGKVEWLQKNHYNRRSIAFNGRTISVYYISEYSLVGLSYRFSPNDLPKEILNQINERYSKCSIEDALVFMDNNGHIKYYALVKSSRRYTAIKITADLKVSVMKKIPVK